MLENMCTIWRVSKSDDFRHLLCQQAWRKSFGMLLKRVLRRSWAWRTFEEGWTGRMLEKEDRFNYQSFQLLQSVFENRCRKFFVETRWPGLNIRESSASHLLLKIAMQLKLNFHHFSSSFVASKQNCFGKILIRMLVQKCWFEMLIPMLVQMLISNVGNCQRCGFQAYSKI